METNISSENLRWEFESRNFSSLTTILNHHSLFILWDWSFSYFNLSLFFSYMFMLSRYLFWSVVYSPVSYSFCKHVERRTFWREKDSVDEAFDELFKQLTLDKIPVMIIRRASNIFSEESYCYYIHHIFLWVYMTTFFCSRWQKDKKQDPYPKQGTYCKSDLTTRIMNEAKAWWELTGRRKSFSLHPYPVAIRITLTTPRNCARHACRSVWRAFSP